MSSRSGPVLSQRRDLHPDLDGAARAGARRALARRARARPCRPAGPARRPAMTSRASTGRHSRARPADSRRSCRARAASARRTQGVSSSTWCVPLEAGQAPIPRVCRPRSKSTAPGQHRPGAHQRVEPRDRVAVARRSGAGSGPRATCRPAQPERCGAVAVTRRPWRRPRAAGRGRRSATSTSWRKKPSQTLSPRPPSPNVAEAVVPVAAADQRQAVRPDARQA